MTTMERKGCQQTTARQHWLMVGGGRGGDGEAAVVVGDGNGGGHRPKFGLKAKGVRRRRWQPAAYRVRRGPNRGGDPMELTAPVIGAPVGWNSYQKTRP